MRMLQQHGGMIYVRSDDGVYIETPENFERDYGSPMPELLPQFDERVYEPDKRHALSFESSVVDGGPMPWPEGDEIIAANVSLLSKQTARKQEEWSAHVGSLRKADAEEQARLNAEMRERMQQLQAGGEELKRQMDALPTIEEKRALAQKFNEDLMKRLGGQGVV